MQTAHSSAPLLFGAVGGNFSASSICSVENLISKSYRSLSKIIFGKLEQTTLRVPHPPAPETFWKGEATEPQNWTLEESGTQIFWWYHSPPWGRRGSEVMWKFYFTCFFFPRGLSGRKLLTVAGDITSGFPAPYF